MDIKLTIPFGEELTKEAGWIQLTPYLYFITRFHLHIEQSQTRDFAVGDILRTYRTTTHSETQGEDVWEEEVTTVNLWETIRWAALSWDLTNKITATIAGAAKSPLYEASANLGVALEQTVHDNVAESIRSSQTVSRREKKTFMIMQTAKPGAQELQYAVAGYRKYRQNVYLHYIDYLFVEYKRTAFGLRRKKRNLPRPVGTAHINVIPMHIPLFRLSYWNLEADSSLLLTETEYRTLPKVAQPDRVTFDELDEPIQLRMPTREQTPTLYTLSHIAFPLRWIDRKGLLTREELEKIEFEEAEGSWSNRLSYAVERVNSKLAGDGTTDAPPPEDKKKKKGKGK
jgi:hypothetical protein